MVCVCALSDSYQSKVSDSTGRPEETRTAERDAVQRRKRPKPRKPYDLDSEGEETSDESSSEKVCLRARARRLSGSDGWMIIKDSVVFSFTRLGLLVPVEGKLLCVWGRTACGCVMVWGAHTFGCIV